MKKLMVAIFLFVVLCDIKIKRNDFSLTEYFTGEFTFYTNENMENSIDLGFCNMATDLVDKNKIIGESVVLKNYEVNEILKTLKADVVETNCLDCGVVVICAFSPLVNREIRIKNRDVNLQIAVRENDVVIGWPLILGSF